MDLLGLDIFSTLWMKGQVLHRKRAHLKVPDWSLVWNELLTKKLPMFLSRLNEIDECYEKIVPISQSFWSDLKFLRMKDLTAWLWGLKMWEWMECDQHFPSQPFVLVLTVDQFVGCGGDPLERQKQDSHVYRKTSTLLLFFRKNQSRHYINDEVWETVK